MLTFSKKSWHYQLAKFGRSKHWWYPPTNLCPYVHCVLTGLFLVTLVACFVSAEILSAVDMVALFYNLHHGVSASIWYGFDAHGNLVPFAGLFILSMIVATFIGGIFGIMFIVEKVREARERREMINRANGISLEKTPGLISSWIHAKHDKVCPRITFVEDSENDPSK